MAFSGSLTVADEINSNATFVENFRQGTRVVRIDTASTLAAPKQMTIEHFATKVNGIPAVRHNVQFSKATVLSSGVRTDTIVNFSVTVPEGATSGDPDEMVGSLINFIIGTNAARTLANLDELLLNQS